MHEVTSSGESAALRQAASEVLGVLPEDSPIVAVMDSVGHCWSSNPDELARLGLPEPLLAEMRARVDDGVEPCIVETAGTLVIATQLCTDQPDCRYVVIVLPGISRDQTVANTPLAEALLQQVELSIKLAENHRRLCERHRQYFGSLALSSASVN